MPRWRFMDESILSHKSSVILVEFCFTQDTATTHGNPSSTLVGLWHLSVRFRDNHLCEFDLYLYLIIYVLCRVFIYGTNPTRLAPPDGK